MTNGVDIYTKNQYKQTPLDRAKCPNNDEAVNILRLYGFVD